MIAALLCLFAAPTQAASHQVTVLDDAGRPIEGARVLGIHEVLWPVWGQRWSRTSGVTGAEGQVELPKFAGDARYAWLMVEADGYGGRGRKLNSRDGELEIRLVPEVPITLEVVDFLGRPLPLAHVGVAFGCGHTPDMVSATTGPDGRAALGGLAPYDGDIDDVYVVHPKASMPYYDSVPFRDAVNGVARFFCEPGSLLEGQVLLPDGEPAVGYGVGNNETHRGHWAITDERGEFALFGCEPRPGFVRVLSPEGEWGGGFDGSRAGVYRTLQLDGTDTPEAFVDGPGKVKHVTREVLIEVSVAEPAKIADGVPMPNHLRWIPVEIWDPVTGACYRDETDENGRASIALPAGDYRVEVGGPESAYSAHRLGPLTVTTGGEDEPLVQRAELPAPRVCIALVEGLREGEQVNIQTANGNYFNKTWLKDSGAESFPAALLVPSGPWSAHIFREVEDGHHRRIQLELPRQIGATLTLRIPD